MHPVILDMIRKTMRMKKMVLIFERISVDLQEQSITQISSDTHLMFHLELQDGHTNSKKGFGSYNQSGGWKIVWNHKILRGFSNRTIVEVVLCRRVWHDNMPRPESQQRRKSLYIWEKLE